MSAKRPAAATGRAVRESSIGSLTNSNPPKVAGQDIFALARQVPVLRVVQELGRVKLRQRGRYFVGLCPFHQEKTPSFTVTPEKQLFYCFGCGVGGDSITFVSRLHGLSPLDAARTICEAYGLAVDHPPSPAARRRLWEEITARQREREFEVAFERWRTATIRGLGVLERACQRVIRKGPGNPGFSVACELEPRIGYLLDILLYGPRETQIELFRREGWGWTI